MPGAFRKAVFTIVSRNYLHYARTLMASLQQHEDGVDRYVLLCDRDDGAACDVQGPFETVWVGQIPIPQPQRFFFRYTVLEANTAVKPWMFAWLFERGYDQVVYLDPDIRVYRPLQAVEQGFDGGHFMVLTPHLTAPIEDDARPGETDILRAGSYNLGFLALRRDPRSAHFLAWWQRKLEFDCVVDVPAGLFVDQKWMDLVPGLYDGVRILRDPGCNVAYWNIAHRPVQRSAEGWSAGGSPLTFFHFSGIDARDPEPFSKHQSRFTLADIGPAAELARDYARELMANGCERYAGVGYGFGRFADGRGVSDLFRRSYRGSRALQDALGDDPFEHGAAFDAPVTDNPLYTEAMRAVWSARHDVQVAFPNPGATHALALARWFVAQGAAESRVDPGFVPAVQRAIDSATAVVQAVGGGDAAALEPHYPFVRQAYLVCLQREADPIGLEYFAALMAHGATREEVMTRMLMAPEGFRLVRGGLARVWRSRWRRGRKS